MTTNLLNSLKLTLAISRNFHRSSQWSAKPGPTMKKIMSGGSKKRRVFCKTPLLPTALSLSKGSFEGKYSGNSKRVNVLNKLFIRHITDLMATGEHASVFVGQGIEVSRVEIAPDYRIVNVFWVTKDRLNEDEVAVVLEKNAGFLRHELSTLRVMGEVPMVKFVKDKQYGEIVELDKRLANADYGDEFRPMELASKLKMQLELYTALDSETREKIQNLEEDSEYEEPLPAMPQDVFGLNHTNIVRRIQQSMKKSEALHRLTKSEEPEKPINENPISYISNKERRLAFKKFLQDREIIRCKSKRIGESQDYLDMEYLREEDERCRREYYDNMEIYDDEVDDYLSEDEK